MEGGEGLHDGVNSSSLIFVVVETYYGVAVEHVTVFSGQNSVLR